MKKPSTQQVPSIAQLSKAQHSSIHHCLLDHRDGHSLNIPSFLPLLLDDLLVPTSMGIEMSGITIDCDVDPDNIAEHLIGIPGITFDFMGEYVTLPTREAIRYICDWCHAHVQEDRENILSRCQALKDKFQP